VKKIAIFGKPGSGKSTFSMKLAISSSIKYCPLDSIEYLKNGERVSITEYNLQHEKLINESSWIIDGLGYLDSFWARIQAADIVIYIDLPYRISYWWVTKRLLISPFKHPESWPEGSSVLKGTIASWKYLRLSPKFWNEEFYDKLKNSCENRKLIRITSVKEMNEFCKFTN
jgi:adenylate kinase family enzyme